MSNQNKKSNDGSEDFSEEHRSYVAAIDMEYSKKMDPNLIRRLSDPPKLTSSNLESSPLKRLIKGEGASAEHQNRPIINETDRWRAENCQTTIASWKVPVALPSVELETEADKTALLKSLKHNKLSDINRNYFVFFSAPYVHLYALATNKIIKVHLGNHLVDAQLQERINFLTLQRYCGHDLLMLLTSDLYLIVLLIKPTADGVKLCEFEPKFNQKIRTKTFFFKNGIIYYRHENEVHSLHLAQIPENIPDNYIGQSQWMFYARQFERFESFDVTEDARMLYILTSDRISVSNGTFPLHVFKPKLEINEHIKVIKCVPKEFKLKSSEDNNTLNDFVFTLTNMNRLIVHDATLMNKQTEAEFRVGKFDLVDVFKLHKMEGQFTDFRVFAKARLVVLKHSHLKDFFCLTMTPSFLQAESSDDLLAKDLPKDQPGKEVVRISKDYCGKSTSSIQRMSESKKSVTGKIVRVFKEEFFDSKFVLANNENLSSVNYSVWCKNEGSEAISAADCEIVFFGIDGDFKLMMAKLPLSEARGDKVKPPKNVTADLTAVFNANAQGLTQTIKSEQAIGGTTEISSPERTDSPDVQTAEKHKLNQNDAEINEWLKDNKNNDDIEFNELIAVAPPKTEADKEVSEPTKPLQSVSPIADENLPKEPISDTLPNDNENKINQTLMSLAQIWPGIASKNNPPQEISETLKVEMISEPPLNATPKETPEAGAANSESQPEPQKPLAPEDLNKNQNPRDPAQSPDKKERKSSKSEIKKNKKRLEEFAISLNDYLMEHHNESITAVKSFVEEFKKMFLSEINTAVPENVKYYSKVNYEHIMRSIENSLNKTFEQSVKKVLEKYTGTCEKAVAKLSSSMSDEQTSFQNLSRELSEFMEAQLDTTNKIKNFTNVMVEVSRDIESHQNMIHTKPEDFNKIYHGLTKVLKQQKTLGDNFKLLTQRVDMLERRAATQNPPVALQHPVMHHPGIYPHLPRRDVYQQPLQGYAAYPVPEQISGPILSGHIGSVKADESFSLRNAQTPPNVRGFSFGQYMPSPPPPDSVTVLNESRQAIQESKDDISVKNQTKFQHFDA